MIFKPIETFRGLPIGIRRIIISSSLFLTIILGGYKADFEIKDWFFSSLFVFLPLVTVLATSFLWILDGFMQVKSPTSIPIIPELNKLITPDIETKNKERFEAAFRSLLQIDIDINNQRKNSKQRTGIKIPIIIKEKDILSYSNTCIRDGLLTTLSEIANFSFSDLKQWSSKISFHALSKNQNVSIDKKVLELFESAHSEGFTSNKYEWDSAYYDEQITQLSFEETVKLAEQLLMLKSSAKKAEGGIVDDDLPF